MNYFNLLSVAGRVERMESSLTEFIKQIILYTEKQRNFGTVRRPDRHPQ